MDELSEYLIESKYSPSATKDEKRAIQKIAVLENFMKK